MTAPTTKQFTDMMQFLINRIDPTHSWKERNSYVQEVPELMKSFE